MNLVEKSVLRNSFSDLVSTKKPGRHKNLLSVLCGPKAFIADEDTVLFIFYSENVLGNSMNCNKMWKEHLKLIH